MSTRSLTGKRLQTIPKQRGRDMLVNILLTCLVTSCASIQPTAPPSQIMQPKARPTHNLTSFDESLRCMDGLFLDYGIKDVVITSQGIPDATGEIRTGTKEMLISAISRMSTYSGAFRFVDYDQRQFDINELQQLVGFTEDFLIPNYYIRGAITQFDEQVISQSKSGGLSFSVLDIGASGSKVTSLVSIDLNVGNLLTRQILTGTTANNTIAVSRSNRSADSNGSIDKINLGLSFNVNLGISEGMHQSVRTLLQLSAIESLGKLTEVPYWQCLALGQTSTAMMEQARAWFTHMTPDEQRTFVQRALSGMGVYQGSVDGKDSAQLTQAIGRYQSGKNLLADGSLNFQLYASLISEDLALGQAAAEPTYSVVEASVPSTTSKQPHQPSSSTKDDPAPFVMSITTGKDEKRYKAGDTLSITVNVTEDAFAYCYYEDNQDSVVRLFPNRFQPNALIGADIPLLIPGERAQFDIVLEHPGGEEEILCLASKQELGIYLPTVLKGQDLSRLDITSLDDVTRLFGTVADTQRVDQRLSITVAP